MSRRQQFDISIDHALMIGAKAAVDTCLRQAVAKAISYETADMIRQAVKAIEELRKDRARVITPEEIEETPRASVIWIEFYDGEKKKPGSLFAALKCSDGSLVDEEGSIYDDFAKDMEPDEGGDCWRFWDREPTGEERKNTKWVFEQE